MTKILFARGINCYPILATNDEWFRADAETNGSDMDDNIASSHYKNLGPGLYVWEGEPCEPYFCDDGQELVNPVLRPATRQDLDELGFPCHEAEEPFSHQVLDALYGHKPDPSEAL
jgi:hypothetical protein